jgi:hypothetical protein
VFLPTPKSITHSTKAVQRLGKLMGFKEARNDMEHYRLDFNDDSLKSFKMKYIGNDGNEERIMYKHYTVEQMKNVIAKFRKANVRLRELSLFPPGI